MGDKIYPVNTIFDTCLGQSLVRVDFFKGRETEVHVGK